MGSYFTKQNNTNENYGLKRKQSPFVIDILQNILNKINKCENFDEDDFKNCTFIHIVTYIYSNYENDRFRIACQDFGYTKDEIDKFKMRGTLYHPPKPASQNSNDITVKLIIDDILDR
uniref:Uncharacterized protein n=1 Tax=viral metagenome TaxID=1070528 RepID=A0A6C0JSF4_9ZZZZ